MIRSIVCLRLFFFALIIPHFDPIVNLLSFEKESKQRKLSGMGLCVAILFSGLLKKKASKETSKHGFVRCHILWRSFEKESKQRKLQSSGCVSKMFCFLLLTFLSRKKSKGEPPLVCFPSFSFAEIHPFVALWDHINNMAILKLNA